MNKPSNKIRFKSLLECQKGKFYSILYESYEKLLAIFPQYKARLIKDWRNFDEAIFKFPNSVGKCGFISFIQEKIIGFASWDPRLGPNMGILGQNCILPEYRRNLYGKLQINEILRILRSLKFLSAKVTTGDHPFFIPAQKMYESCGFIMVRVIKGSNNPYFNEIEYFTKL